MRDWRRFFRGNRLATYICRNLTLRIGLVVLLSIFLIEGIILVPSYRNYERDLEASLASVGRATMVQLARGADRTSNLDEWFKSAALGARGTELLGGAVYDLGGGVIGKFGEMPALQPAGEVVDQRLQRRSADGRRLDVVWHLSLRGAQHTVVARLDATRIGAALRAFVFRIVGLVLAISGFVAVSTMVILRWAVIKPVQMLRANLLAAAQDPTHPARYTVASRRRDELGDVLTAFNTMVFDVARWHEAQIARVVAMTDDNIDAIVAYDKNGQLVYCNRACLVLCGYPTREALAAFGHPRILLDGDDRALGLPDCLPRLPMSEEATLLVSEGRTVPCLISANRVVSADDETELVYASIRDATEIQEYRRSLLARNFELANANRAKSEFLANTSHELRTPLNAIIGFSDILCREMFGPLGVARYREYAGAINESGRHLLDIINDILDLSKLEAGRHELREEWVDLADVVGATMRLVKERADDGGVVLTKDVPGGLPQVWGDERKLKQIFTNLLSNAIKFTPEGGWVEIRIRAARHGGLSVTVQDTGIGMSAEEIEIALSPFGQVDGSLDRKYEGTGLGLPITKGLIELHGGSLQVASEPGNGTDVTVRLPPERCMAIDALSDRAGQIAIAEYGT